MAEYPFGGKATAKEAGVPPMHNLAERNKQNPNPMGSDLRSLKTNPNFDTNAPPFEIRGCKVILGGAFLSRGGAVY